MRYSRYVDHFIYKPYIDDKQWIADINAIVDEKHIDIIMPVYEDGIRTLLKNSFLLNHPEKLALLSTYEDYNTATNKALLSQHLKTHGIPHPETEIFDKTKNDTITTDLSFPIILKPARGIDGQGIHMVKDETALGALFESINELYVIQEYIEGYDIDCSVLCKDGNILSHTIQKANLYESRAHAPPIGIDFIEEHKLLDVVEPLMRTLNWSGLAHIDLRYDQNTGTFKVIEVNGRFWGSLDASMQAGVNFVHQYIQVSLGETIASSSYQTITYLNLKGVVKQMKKRPLILLRFKFLKQHTPLFFAIKDPLPIIFRFYNRTRVKLKKVFSN